MAARSVQPFEIRIPATGATSLHGLKAAKSSTAKNASVLGRRFVPVPKMMIMFYACEWISGGTVDTGDGPVVTPGSWSCGFEYGYAPDPAPPPVEDGSGSGGTPEASGMPLTPQETQLLNQAKSVANNRLSTVASCEKMFDDLGKNGATVISATTYRDGGGSSKCTSRPGAAAVTDVGSYTVFLCGLSFTNLSSNGAAFATAMPSSRCSSRGRA